MNPDSFKLAEIRFDTNRQTPRGQKIELGAVAELWFRNWRCLAIVARSSLAAHEIKLLTPISKELFKDGPFEYLERSFDQAWKNASPGEAIAYLCGLHHNALYLTPPVELAIPDAPDDVGKSWIVKIVSNELNKRFAPSVDVPITDQERLEKRAA